MDLEQKNLVYKVKSPDTQHHIRGARLIPDRDALETYLHEYEHTRRKTPGSFSPAKNNEAPELD